EAPAYDPEAAKALLEESGYKDGEVTFEIAMDNTSDGNRMQVGQFISEQLKEIGTELTNAGKALAPLSKASAAVTGGLLASAKSAGKTADDLNTLSKVTGISVEQLQKYKAAADFVDVSVESIAKSQQKLKKTMASAKDGTKAAAENFAKLGVTITDADGKLRDSDDVFQDVIAALGQMEEGTERDALAMEIYGTSAGELNPLIEDAGETYRKVAETFETHSIQPLSQDQLDKAQAFQDKLDELKLVGGTALEQLGAKAAEALLPALEKIVEWGGKVVDWVSNLSPEVVQIVAIIGTLLAVLSPLLILLGALATAAGALNIAMLPFTAIILGIIAAIGLLVYAGIELAKNWDDIKQHATDAWNGIKEGAEEFKNKIVGTWETIKQKASELWEKVKNAIVQPFETAKQKVEDAVAKIKSFFPINIKELLSKIKLPHFSLTGSFSLVPPSIPKLSVDWYDKGGIFDSPSIIGVGEKRPEFVGALDDLRDIVREESRPSIGSVTINIYPEAGQNVNDIADAVQDRMVQLLKQEEAAYGTI
ncbi:MAG: phage tail tape measure protein, partial [Oscillospiraceae bacterium]|nr:phage tail tape measure protein [Oscillospiraceae bacterium]